MSALSVKNLTVKFGSFVAVDNVSFEASEGSFVTLLGPSGCGKTTLLKTLAGFYKPDAGVIEIDGRNVTNVPPEKRNTAMCFQSYALFPHITVAENIIFGPKQKKLAKQDCERRLKTISEQVDLETQLKKLPSALSGGQQQRVALARALAMRSGIVLFDEPLSNLDAALRDQVRYEIRQLQRDHCFTAIYVTHDQSEALAMSDRILVIKDGRIVQQGTPKEIYHAPINRFVAGFIGTANIMKANVVSRDPENKYYRISTPLGVLNVRSDLPPGSDRVFTSWRPEDAQLLNVSTQIQENKVTLTINSNVFLGNLSDLNVTPSGHEDYEYRVQLLGSSDLKCGDSYEFHIPSHCLRFLEDASS